MQMENSNTHTVYTYYMGDGQFPQKSLSVREMLPLVEIKGKLFCSTGLGEALNCWVKKERDEEK